jgi:hypothetical protein
VTRKLPLGEGEAARTACAPGLLRAAVEEETGEVLSAAVLAERVGWAAGLVSGMAGTLTGAHWNAVDVDALALGEDAGGRPLPSNAWMALRRLGWAVAPPVGIRVNDRIVRMAQETAGRALRSAKWRADVTAGIVATWPDSPDRRTAEEWDAVREAIPGGRHLPSGVISSRTRQAAAFPEGHAHTDRPPLPRAATRNQDVTTTSPTPTRRHQPRGAALGVGFHLHAHAPPRWAQPAPDTMSRTGPLS